MGYRNIKWGPMISRSEDPHSSQDMEGYLADSLIRRIKITKAIPTEDRYWVTVEVRGFREAKSLEGAKRKARQIVSAVKKAIASVR